MALLQTIARQYSTKLRTRLLSQNPVTAAHYFQYRLDDVLKLRVYILGEIADYVIRIEFQVRGSPHAHTGCG
jgi:hypothetical protein